MKRRILSFLISFVFCLLSIPASNNAVAETSRVNILEYDTNKEKKEYIITSAEGLLKFSNLSRVTEFRNKTVYLACDIDMSEYIYEPFVSFAGTFDGQFHSIKNLEITVFNRNTGFIGMLNEGGTVKNLGINGGNITGKVSTGNERIGSIAGVNNHGIIDGCWSTANIKGEKYSEDSTTDISVGGITGGNLNGGIVSNSYFAGNAIGVDHVSGISDWCQGHYSGSVGKIINCYEAGTYSAKEVFPLGRYAGSILAENKPSAIVDSYYGFDGIVYSWANMKKYTKAQLGNGELAYILDKGNTASRSRIWKQGLYFPELCGNSGVFPLTIKVKTSDNIETTHKTYMNFGDTYTPYVEGADITVSSDVGNVSENVFTMPSSAANITVTVSVPNISSISSQSDKNQFIVTNYDGFKSLGTFINSGKGTMNGKTIYMIHDVDMGNTLHTPVGVFVSDNDWSKSFCGTFDGNGYRIFNLNVNKSSLNGAGLFGSSKNAVFKRLGIFNGTVTADNRAGGITGYGDTCVFSECFNGADVTTLTGADGCGGIAGVSRVKSKFYYCYNFGNITAKALAAGGISGWGQDNFEAYSCFNVGNVYASSEDSFTALIRTPNGVNGKFYSCFYLNSVKSVNGGTKYSYSNMTNDKFGYVLNTQNGSVENSEVYTNTPRFPAIKRENDGYAMKTEINAESAQTGEHLSSIVVYGNEGDCVGIKENGNFYVTTSAVIGESTKIYITEPLYSIQYVLNGGIINEASVDGYCSSVSTMLPQNVTKDGFVFMGWYEDENTSLNPIVCIAKGSTGNKMLYAKWGILAEISSIEDYKELIFNTNSGVDTSNIYARLENDIDLTDMLCEALGTKEHPFKGVFDGNGYTVKGYSLKTPNDNLGFVGRLKGGIVKNLYLEGNEVTGDSNVGAIVGYNDGGVIYNCGSNGIVCSDSNTAEVSIMSFNIRVPGDASPNSISNRIPRVKAFINECSPDIIGLQEVTSEWKTEIDKILSNYNSEFVYRAKDSLEAAPLYWKKSKFDCLEKGSFWLSETPDVESKSWQSGCHRTCSYAVLKEKISGRIILAFNTHLDHQSEYARTNGLKVIKERMQALENKYTLLGYEHISSFLSGDYNAEPYTAPHKVLEGYLVDSKNVANTMISPAGTNTFNAFSSWNGHAIIDYIYVDNKDMDILTYKVCNENKYGGFVSDHFGVFVTISLTDKAAGGLVGTNTGSVVNCFFAGTVIGSFCTGGLVGDNHGYIVGGYSVPFIWADNESGAIAGVNRGIIHETYYVHDALNGACGKNGGIETTASVLKSDVSVLLKYGSWKIDANVNGGYPINDITPNGFRDTLVLKKSSKYILKDNMLLNVIEKQTAEEILSNFENEGLVIEGNSGTGGKVCLELNGEIVDYATIIILGDLDGNGLISSTDYIRLKSTFLEQFDLDGAFLIAADVNSDGKITSSDYLRMKSHFLNQFNIFE